jgi:tryptophan synthase alpha chain
VSARLAPLFESCRVARRAALIGYLPAGYPTVDGSRVLLRAMLDGGCDLVEVGVPYSDPVMDGPTIQAAADAALRAGVRLRDVLSVVESVATAGGRAVVMTYWNPVHRYGVAAFARDLAATGGLGIITPDLIPDEAQDWLAAAQAHDLDRIFLVAPSTTDQRLVATAAATRGFLYAASTMGVTGARDVVSSAAPALVARVREHVPGLPVGVGLGVRNGAHAAEVAAFADAVIVGSAFVTAAGDGEAGIRALAADLASGVRRPAPQPA